MANDGATFDEFGHSVSLDGDTALVGAFADDDNGDDSGSVYVFTRAANLWSQQTKITPEDGADGDNFGCSVSFGDSA